MNIYLIGMMGSGKSTVGKILSKKLEIPFLDIDHYIEVKAHKTISEIFTEDGESRFRQLESEVLETIEHSNLVAACGGGIVLNQTNRNQLASSGKVIFLDTSIQVLAKRLQSVIDRPLLGGKEVENELSRLWADRENLYKDTCHFSVNTNQSTAEEVAINIYNQIN